MKPFISGLFVFGALWATTPALVHAQAEVVPDTQTYEKARVVEVLDERSTVIPGTDTPARSQTLRAEVLSGPSAGTIITFENDYPLQLEKGTTFYARHTSQSLDDTDLWTVADAYRLPILGLLAFAFVVLLFTFGGIQGVRGLASLVGSIVLIFYLLIPSLYAGSSPILVSIGVSSLIIVVGSYITHGFNRATSSAVIGMIITVVMVGLAAYAVMQLAHLTGYTSDEQVYLNFDTRGAIDMVGLLFGGIMIGLLGVLYDIAIGQAIAVEELFRVGKNTPRGEIYRRGIRIGREHIGALVNTLAIAYVGASLPLLLLIQSADTDLLFMLNSEIFATEIIRILIGSIGLILAVPITTLIATYLLAGRVSPITPSQRHTHAH